MSTMDPIELARWTRFAAKGGIGKCTAVNDCVAESSEDLMFLTDDEITVLLQVPEKEGVYLGYCEGVIGRFNGADVRFHSKLKKPVMAKRSSSTSLSSAASHSNLKSASPSVTASPPASRLGGFTIGGLVAGNGQGTGSRGSTPASPFATSFRTDSRSSLKKEVLDPGSGSPSLRDRESRGGKLPLLSNGLAHAGPKDPPPSNSRAQSPPTMTVSPPATTDLSTFKSSTSPPQTTRTSPQHSSPPISPPSTATSATTSSTQPPSEILNLQRHFQLVEEGWKRESMVPSSRTSPAVEGDAGDLSSQSLDLLDAQIDPLRITKKSPTFPPSPFLPPPDSQESLSSLSPLPSPRIQLDAKREEDSSEAPPPPVVFQEKTISISTPDVLAQTLVIPAVSTPDSSQLNTSFSMYSEGSWGDRFDVASDAEGAVGIGLSLLQNLADGEDTDDEDGSEYSGSGGVASNRASNARSSHVGTASTVSSPGLSGRFSSTTVGSPTTVGSSGYRAASGGGTSAVGGLTRQDSTASTIAGLRYGSESSDEDDEDETFTVPSTGTFPMPPTHVFPISPPVSSPPSANSILQQLSPTSHQFPHPSRPIPQRSQSYSSLLSQKSQGSLSPTAHVFPAPKSPTSPTLSSHPPVFSSPSSQSSTRPPRERRPSNAPSLAPSLAASTASWEGDIYDDYRYSRYSMTSSFGGSLGRNGGKRFSSMSALSAAGTPGDVGSPEVPPVPERKDSYFDSPRGSMDRERVRVDSGESINSQKLVHPLSVFHSKQDSDASIYTQGSRTSVQPQTGFGRRSRLEDVEEIPKEQSARSSLVAAAGSLRSSPSLQASSLRSSPSIGTATLRSRSNSNATTLEGGAGTRSRSNSTHHRPPPLALTNSNVARADSKSNTVSASSTAPTTTTTSSTSRDSSISTSSNNSASVLTTGSPLLHATWGSPLSSPSSSMGAGTTAGLGSAVGAGGFGFVTSPTGSSFRGAASAMRQMIEESQKSPTAVPGGYSLVHHATKIPEGEGARSLDMSVDSSFAKGTHERGIVMDDDEELPSHVRVDDSYTTADDSNTTLLYDSSPPRVRVNQQEGQEKRSSAEDDEGQELDVDDIPILPATPISAAAPPLPPSASNSTLVPPSSSTDVVLPASPSQPSHLRPSLRDLREGGTVRVPGTMERRSLFLPHPNAPKTPKDLGGEESPGPMYVRDRGTPPGSATGEGEMSSVAPPNPSSQGTPPPNSTNQPLHNPQLGPPQPGNYPYQHQPPPPHMMMPPRPTARQIIIQSLTRPPPPMPPPIGPPGAQRRLLPRGPTIYGRIEGDFTTAMGPIPITWSVDPPPTKARIVPQAQMQGPGMGGPGMGMGPAMNAPAIHFGGQGIGPGGSPGGSPGGGNHQPLPGANPVPTHPPVRSSPLRSGSTALPTEDISNGLGKRPSVVSLRERTISSSPLATSVELPKEDANANTGVAPGGGAPIPRANFFPKVGAVGARPRSRSFSGVSANEEASKKNEGVPGGRGIKKTNSFVAPAPANATGKGAQHRPSPLSLPQNNITTGPPSNPSSATPTSTTHKLRPQLSTPNFKPPSSPLARDVTFGSRASPVPPPSPKRTTSQDRVPLSPRKISFGLGKPTSPPTTLETIPSGQVPNITRVTSPDSTRSATSPPPTGPTGVVPGVGLHLRRLTGSRSAVNLRDRSDSNSSWEEAAGFRPPSTSSTTSISRPIPIPRSTLSPPPTFQTLGGSTNSSPHGSLRLDTNFSLGMASGETTSSPVGSNAPQTPPDDAASIRSGINGSDSRSQMVTSPSSFVTAQTHLNHGQPTSPVQRSNSLKNKLSLPNLRRNRSRAEDDANANEFLLQVHDTDFEFVRPALGHFAAARGSEDSGVLGREAALESAGSTVTGSGGSTTFLRGESPAMSMFSNRSPTTEGNGGWSNPKSSLSLPPRTGSPTSPVTPDTATIEAHRNREQKWMSLLGSSPASQARKSKKVRKLLLEGVPASVRYLVWNHLTDGKGKALPSVYPQLCKRGPVPLSDRIEADVETSVWFLDEKQSQLQTLREAGGGIVQLLEAYLNMVPDIQYSPGLPHIVGQLLLVAPEEDAFWIFVSIMDTHIRPYFASGSAQMDVDASLFKTALEVNDPQLAKKLFVDMGILPVSICQPWFSSLFVGCLPDDYLARTWDIFLYEGVPFLLRVGLALTSFVRRQLLECTSEEAVLSMLHRPPLTRLPPNTENYLTSALNVKLKDDDIKKQRVKLEAQVKRQTQQQAPRSAGSISLPRT